MAQHEAVTQELGTDIGAEITAGSVSRRNFMKVAGITGAGLFAGTVFGGVPSLSALTKTPILVGAKGVLVQDVTRCVACRRCELACSEFNDGAASSYFARVKVGRNLTFKTGMAPGKNADFRVQADLCKQCPHPVPCAEACPKGAIRADADTGARKVDPDVCVGCGVCTKACPWGMLAVNPTTQKSSKCFLCDGAPECARACPTGALKYVAWRDLRATTPQIQPGIIADPSTTAYCAPCHS